MTRDRLKVGDRYFMRIKNKQVPVVFCGFMAPVQVGLVANHQRLQFKVLSDGTTLYKFKAGALSKHQDDCCFRVGCSCEKMLGEL